MSETDKPKVQTETTDEAQEVAAELVDEFEGLDIDNLIPAMNVNDEAEIEKECFVKDDDMMELYEEILDNARKDRESVDEVLANFTEMVMNEGDASSASKEAIVNLIKIKSDTSDKMAKVADLMTRIKLKERDTFPRYLAAQQNNKVVIEGSKREMIKSINKIAARKQNDKPDK
tara:strand:- start:656 stop:1177 length:522 start_codon:yes stop_codon:yes gene_type:complete